MLSLLRPTIKKTKNVLLDLVWNKQKKRLQIDFTFKEILKNICAAFWLWTGGWVDGKAILRTVDRSENPETEIKV